MKRLFAWLLVLACLCSLAACAAGETDKGDAAEIVPEGTGRKVGCPCSVSPKL